MPNNRAKGLIFCREVKKILEAIGHQVEGPSYTTAFFGGKTNAIHRDYFSIFDLISFFEGGYFFHQVSALGHKSEKIKAIQAKRMPGWVWSRVSNGKVFYRIFDVKASGDVQEAEIRWKI